MTLRHDGLSDFTATIEAARIIAALSIIQWEYKFLTPGPDLESNIQMEGMGGWELVGEILGRIVMKRPRVEV